jgi:hypothetical protein
MIPGLNGLNESDVENLVFASTREAEGGLQYGVRLTRYPTHMLEEVNEGRVLK